MHVTNPMYCHILYIAVNYCISLEDWIDKKDIIIRKSKEQFAGIKLYRELGTVFSSLSYGAQMDEWLVTHAVNSFEMMIGIKFYNSSIKGMSPAACRQSGKAFSLISYSCSQ